MTVNQKGRTERIYVNLEAIYPDPETLGTELSLEELRAGYHGWLTQAWQPEFALTENVLNLSTQSQHCIQQIEEVSRSVSEKLVIARDPVGLDENGAAKETSREGRSRRMKIKEVNETQISEYCSSS